MHSFIGLITLVGIILLFALISFIKYFFDSLGEIKASLKKLTDQDTLYRKLNRIEAKLNALLPDDNIESKEAAINKTATCETKQEQVSAQTTEQVFKNADIKTETKPVTASQEIKKTEPVPAPVSELLNKQETPSIPPELPDTPKVQTQQKQEQAQNTFRMPRPEQVHVEPQEIPVSAFEVNAAKILDKIWNWIVVGEEYRDKSVSMEYSIASTWLLRSAIIIILTGSAFFLKYSIDNNLVTPMGRVGISILFALTMLVAGLKMIGKKYSLIGQGLTGGGLALFYFSIFAASGMYKLIDVLPAFALMALVTIVAGIISVRINSMLIAILGVIGGYCTPIILNTGVKNFPGLFTYLTLLGFGTLYIAKHKNWKLLNFMAFALTYLLYFAAIAKYDSKTDFTIAFSFLTVFFILFSCVNLIYNIIKKEKATLIELILMFINTCIYFATAYYLIKPLYGKEYIALLCISLAIFYIAQIWYFMKAGIQDKGQLIINSGFASFFITLTIPYLFSDDWITAAWAVQALIFLWMGIKLKSNFVKIVSYVVYLLVFIRLGSFDCPHNFISTVKANYWHEVLSRLITIGSTVLSLIGAWKLLSVEQGKFPPKPGDEEQVKASTILILLASIILFVYLHFEVYFFTRLFYLPVRMPMMTAIWLAGLLFTGVLLYKGSKSILVQSIAYILLMGLIVKVLLIDLSSWDASIGLKQFECAFTTENILMRLLNFGPMIAVMGILFGIFRKKAVQSHQLFGIAALFVLFVYLTLETGTFMSNYMSGMKPGAISVLWGAFAFFLILGGIVKNMRPLRFTGLALFVITIFKIFCFDMSDLTPVYKFSAFIALGLIILVGALIYVKFKDFFNIPSSEKKEKTDEK